MLVRMSWCHTSLSQVFSIAVCLLCLRTMYQHKTVTIKLVTLHLNAFTAGETLSVITSASTNQCAICKKRKEKKVVFQIRWGKARIPVWSVCTAQRLKTTRVPKQTALYFSSLWLFLSSGMWKWDVPSHRHTSHSRVFISNIILMSFLYRAPKSWDQKYFSFKLSWGSPFHTFILFFIIIIVIRQR